MSNIVKLLNNQLNNNYSLAELLKYCISETDSRCGSIFYKEKCVVHLYQKLNNSNPGTPTRCNILNKIIVNRVASLTQTKRSFIFEKDDNTEFLLPNITDILISQDKAYIRTIYKSPYIVNNICIIPIMIKNKILGVLILTNKKISYTDNVVPGLSPYLSLLQIMLENYSYKEINSNLVFGTSKKIFLSNINHEIRTPLNNIVGYSQLLIQTNLNSIQKEYINIINKCSYDFVQKMNDIFDIARFSNGTVLINNEYINITEIIENVKYIINNKLISKNHELKLKLIIQSEIITDKKLLIQLLVNLLYNSNKFTPYDGIIYLNIESTAYGLQFILKNKSEGITNEEVQNILNNNNDITGNNLGMIIAKKIIHLLGGVLQIRNESDNMYVSFTIKNIQKISYDFSTFERTYILVVENNVQTRMFLSEMLYEINMIPITCSNNIEAIKLIKDKRYTFDIVILDLDTNEDYNDFIQLSSIYNFNIISIQHHNKLIFESYIIKPIDKTKVYNILYNVLIQQNTTKNKTIKIAILDHNNYTISLLVNILKENNLQFISTFNNSIVLYEYIEHNSIDILFINIYTIDNIDIYNIKSTPGPRFDIIEHVKEKITNIIAVFRQEIDEPIKDTCIKLGISNFIFKPIEPEKVLKYIHK